MIFDCTEYLMLMPDNDTNNDTAACAVGISVAGHMMEICAMAPEGAVVLHGWFPKSVALLVLGNRPPCHIAVTGEPLPCDVMAGFQARGHSAIIVSKRGMAHTQRTGRIAADACRVALLHAETFAGTGLRRAS
jgi:hypothetical protein